MMEGAKKKKAAAPLSFDDDDDDFLPSWKPGKLGASAGLDLDDSPPPKSSKKFNFSTFDMDLDLDGGLGKFNLDLPSVDDLQPKQASNSSAGKNKFSSNEPSFADGLNKASKSLVDTTAEETPFTKQTSKSPTKEPSLHKTTKSPVEKNVSSQEPSFTDALEKSSENFFTDALSKASESPGRNTEKVDSLDDGVKKAPDTSSSEDLLRSSPAEREVKQAVESMEIDEQQEHHPEEPVDNPELVVIKPRDEARDLHETRLDATEKNLSEKLLGGRRNSDSSPLAGKNISGSSAVMKTLVTPAAATGKRTSGPSSAPQSSQSGANKLLSSSSLAGSKISGLSTKLLEASNNKSSSSSTLAARNIPAAPEIADQSSNKSGAPEMTRESNKTPEAPEKSNFPSSQENHGALEKVVDESSSVLNEKAYSAQSCMELVPVETDEANSYAGLLQMDHDSRHDSENLEKADSYSEILDNMCKLLKQKNEEAKDLMVRSVVTNNSLLMLNSPVHEEKIQLLKQSVDQLLSGET